MKKAMSKKTAKKQPTAFKLIHMIERAGKNVKEGADEMEVWAEVADKLSKVHDKWTADAKKREVILIFRKK
jgi:hypothetical protein